jgi:hypothetical protein
MFPLPPVAEVADLGGSLQTSGVSVPGYKSPVAEVGDLGLPPFPNLRGQRPRLQFPCSQGR